MLRQFFSGRLLAATAAAGVLVLTAAHAAASPGAGDLAAGRKALESLLAEHWEYTLAQSPEFASLLGDKRWNDKLSDCPRPRSWRTRRRIESGSRASR